MYTKLASGQVSVYIGIAPVLNITVQMYPCSEGTDTDSPAL